MLFGLLPSHGTGESGARARLASRTPSVATSVWQIALEFFDIDTTTLCRLFLARRREPRFAAPRLRRQLVLQDQFLKGLLEPCISKAD